MTAFIEVDRIIKPVDKIRAVTRSKTPDIQLPFLQMPVRQERREQGTKLPIEDLITFELGAVKLFLKRRDVIKDLSPARGEVRGKRRIDLREVLIETIELDIDVLFCVPEQPSGRWIHKPF